MANYIISSGETSSGIILNPADRMTVLCGGAVNNTIVSRCSELHIQGGGMANNTTVSKGGAFFVSTGGMANNTTVSDGAGFIVFNGGMANGATVLDGGYFFVCNGGIANEVSRTAGDYSDGASADDANPVNAAACPQTDRNVTFPGSSAAETAPANRTSAENIPGVLGTSFPNSPHPAPMQTENRSICTDLTECRFTDPIRINAIIRSIDPLTKETDRLQVVSLFYAINTGKTLASDAILATLDFTRNSSGQFGYYKRIVKLFRDLDYRIRVVRDDTDAAEDIARAGIDGFDARNLNTARIYRFIQERSTLAPQDITHLVSFLYSVVKRTLMPQSEYEKFEHGPTTQQYGYYHRAIHWLAMHGYRIAVRKES